MRPFTKDSKLYSSEVANAFIRYDYKKNSY